MGNAGWDDYVDISILIVLHIDVTYILMYIRWLREFSSIYRYKRKVSPAMSNLMVIALQQVFWQAKFDTE